MREMLGFCGLKCHDCPTPQAADPEARRAIAVRLCASARGHDTGADCDGYATCEVLGELCAAAPEARAVLDALRRGDPLDGIQTFT